MGWGSGGELFSRVVGTLIINDLEELHPGRFVKTVVEIIHLFEEHDCDTLYEAYGQHGPLVDEALTECGHGENEEREWD